MGSQDYRRLEVWQRGLALAVRVYRLTASGPLARERGLKDQMRRSAVSIPSNVAEGNERESEKEGCRFFFIAKGSAGELATQARIAIEVGSIDMREGQTIIDECDAIGRMLRALVQARSRPPRASCLAPRA